LGGGALTGKYLKADLDDDNRLSKAEYFERYKSDRARQIAQVVVEMAKEIGCSASQLALAWIRHQSPRHIPIIGARTLEHLKDNLRCLDVTLTDNQLARLNEATQTDSGFALRFLRNLQNLFLGAANETLDLSLHPISRLVLDRK
jgi:aryl-alcohol dehydrogenase-like predicted oxidoreductase